jgi:hypothetical protein
MGPDDLVARHVSLPSNRAGELSDPANRHGGRDEATVAKAPTMTSPSVRGDLHFHLQSDCANARSAFETRYSSPADWPHGERIFPGQLKFFCFMTDHQAFALAQRILHLV